MYPDIIRAQNAENPISHNEDFYPQLLETMVTTIVVSLCGTSLSGINMFPIHHQARV